MFSPKTTFRHGFGDSLSDAYLAVFSPSKGGKPPLPFGRINPSFITGGMEVPLKGSKGSGSGAGGAGTKAFVAGEKSS